MPTRAVLLIAILCPRLLADRVLAVGPVSPVAVPIASGLAYPRSHQVDKGPDPRYDAAKAIDRDPNTFCCLLDDTCSGAEAGTIPPRAAAPVTGHMVFDLGRPMLVVGARLTSRDSGGAMNPQNVDFYYFADDDPAKHPRAADLEHDSALKPLVKGRNLARLRSGAVASVAWDGVVARYIAMRVNSSYESGPKHFNFQIAEMEFVAGSPPAGLRPGERLPSLYVKRATLAETLLASRQRYTAAFGAVSDGKPKETAEFNPTDALWQQVRRDFPRAGHPFLEQVHHRWFDCGGWFDQANDTELEQAFIAQALAEIGGAVSPGLVLEFAGLRQSAARPDDPRWLDLCVRAGDLAARMMETKPLRKAIEDLGQSFPQQYDRSGFLRRLQQIEERFVRRACRPGAAADSTLTDFRALQREALVTANPLLAGQKILFVKRYTYSPGWYYAEFMRASRFGGGLCVLSLADGSVAQIATGLKPGIFDRYDISCDGRRIVFAYKPEPGQGFRLFEVDVDGRNLRQLTFDPPDEQERIARFWHPTYKSSGVYRHHTDDFHPCYLPDGGICFASTRCQRGVLCDQSDSLAVNTLYRINADGSGMRCLSGNALSESTPTVANDGRILYTRWEYVDKGVIAVQALWAMHPDGTGSREVYGNDVEFPPVFIHGRPIPGSNHLYVCTATMHHPFAVGPILRIDARRDVRTLEPIEYLTPGTDLSVEGKDGRPHAEKYAHLRNGRWVKDNIGPLFSEPYPLADPETGAGAGKYFLVDCNPDRAWNDPAAYGLYLIDQFGNRVPIYHDPDISCWQPLPLRSRQRPPVIASHVEPESQAPAAKEGTLLLSDVYAGLDGVGRGSIKYLRVMEQVARPWDARRFWPNDSALGQHAVISLNAHIHVKIHHGIVKVHDDGSACFTVPAEKNLFFQALDENYMEVQRMRSFVNLQPGESRSCVGCHQYRPTAPAGRMPLALASPPQRLAGQPGELVPRPIHYPTDVQPILDKHCVQCHRKGDPQSDLDLGNELTEYFNRSYENLMRRKLIAYLQEFFGPQPDAQVTNVEPVAPRTLGSHASRLIAILRKGHYDVRLSPEEWCRLITWTDANGPYYGTYFGRRNLIYRDHADFRPVPTLRSASGVAP